MTISENIYANHDNWEKCWWTGFAVWCALNAEALGKHERLFLAPGVKEGAASSGYCEQLLGMVEKHRVEVCTLMQYERFNPYGLQKGAAALATSWTTASPSMPSIARRGEWSLGVALDVYWHFSKVGDHYLGRILAGLDPNDVEFGSLPPHFVVANPLENTVIATAM